MNRTIALILAAGVALSSSAETIIQAMPFSTEAGMTSDDMKSFNIEMTNEEDIWGLQFDLYLPEGMTLDYTDDYPPYEDIGPVYGDRYPYTTGRGGTKTYKHGVDWNHLKDVPGHFWFAITPNDESFITGTSGTILTLYYLTSADMKPGIYPIVIRKTVISGEKTDVRPTDAISYVKVGDPADSIYNLGSEFYIPSFVQSELVKDANIVVNGVCENLVLTDGMKLPAGTSFTASQVTYDADISSTFGFKTLVLPFDCDVPEGFKAYQVDGVVSNELQMTEMSDITANCPVLLKNVGVAKLTATDAEIEFPDNNPVCGLLTGTYRETDAPVGSYVLQNHDGKVAFYNVGESVRPTVGAFRAYLEMKTVSSLNAIIVNFDDTHTTGIGGYEGIQYDSEYFDMSGRRVDESTHGVNIIRNGNVVTKKYIE